MSLRDYVERLEQTQALIRVTKPISRRYEVAGVLKKLEPQPVLFENIRESPFPVFGNLFSSKAAFASYFGLEAPQIIYTLAEAIDRRSPCRVVDVAPCQEVVDLKPDLGALPILEHCAGDGGPYITSGVFVSRHPRLGQNLDFHRCMQFSSTEMAVRVVRSRDFDAYLQDLGQLDVAICVGNAPNVLAAAATSVARGVDELEIANALEPLSVVRARTVDLFVPAEAELVLEGTVYGDRLHAEGPFVDLTGTYDVVRQQPVLVVRAITHRRDPMWHALLPGGLEHKLLMGMPREPTIFREVSKVTRCLDVNIDPGGCSWLHAVVQIDKQNEEDGRRAIEAAFAGHTSCKHVFVVDPDIDIYDPLDVEWAMATRFQGERDMLLLPRAPGSSLDPSAEPETKMTTRVGFDLTKPLAGEGKPFERATFPDSDPSRFVEEG